MNKQPFEKITEHQARHIKKMFNESYKHVFEAHESWFNGDLNSALNSISKQTAIKLLNIYFTDLRASKDKGLETFVDNFGLTLKFKSDVWFVRSTLKFRKDNFDNLPDYKSVIESFTDKPEHHIILLEHKVLFYRFKQLFDIEIQNQEVSSTSDYYRAILSLFINRVLITNKLC